MRKASLLLPALLLTGCPPCEGPIVVYLDGMDSTAVVTWAAAGSDEFQACTPGISPAYANCGPDSDEAEGTFKVRVTWNDEVFEQEVVVENDSSCVGNVDLQFSTGETTDSMF